MHRSPRCCVLATILLLLAAGGAAAAPSRAAQPPAAGEPPAAVFADLDGTWEGTFVGFDTAGRELYRIRVTQTYATVDESTQRVEVRDVMPDGTVVTGRGANTARRFPDGGLALACTVTKSNGERVEHRGRVIRGPGGEEEILWLTDRPGRRELFRERVVRQGDETLYLIDGTGLYGDTLILMAGRYRKVTEPAGSPGISPARWPAGERERAAATGWASPSTAPPAPSPPPPRPWTATPRGAEGGSQRRSWRPGLSRRPA